MGETEVIKKVIKDLERLKIPYFVTGGFAVSVWGRIRTTHDLDVIVAVSLKDIEIFKEIFNIADFYFSKEAAKQAVLAKTTFNVIHHETGLKIDFWILRNDVFGKFQLRRRKRAKFLDRSIYFISPEDLILIKLQWYKESESERHYFDALSIYQTQRMLNKKYLERWAKIQGTMKFLERIKKDVKILL